MRAEMFADFNDLRGTFASADYVDGLTVFNIGGNKYQLIASIHYSRHKVYSAPCSPTKSTIGMNGSRQGETDDPYPQSGARAASNSSGLATVQGSDRRDLGSH